MINIKLLIIVVVAFNSSLFAQIDSNAIKVLDEMSDFFNQNSTFNVSRFSVYDVLYEKTQWEFVKESDLTVKSLHDFRIDSKDEFGVRSYTFINDEFTLYNVLNNTYSKKTFTTDSLELLDQINTELNIELPLIDFVYKEGKDRLIKEIKSATLIHENIMILGELTTQIALELQDKVIYIWAKKGEQRVPVKTIIDIKKKGYNPHFVSIYLDWNFDSEINIQEINMKPDALKIPFEVDASK